MVSRKRKISAVLSTSEPDQFTSLEPSFVTMVQIEMKKESVRLEKLPNDRKWWNLIIQLRAAKTAAAKAAKTAAKAAKTAAKASTAATDVAANANKQ